MNTIGGNAQTTTKTMQATRRIGERKVHSPIAIYRFRLSAGHSISRTELFKLWSTACRSRDVSVTRMDSASGFGERGHTYSLWGPAPLRCPDIEKRIRDSLVAALPKAVIVLINL